MRIIHNIDKAAYLVLAGVQLAAIPSPRHYMLYEFVVVGGYDRVRPALDLYYSDAPVPVRSFTQARYALKKAAKEGRKQQQAHNERRGRRWR
jgi:hypothetical protein